VLLRALRPTDHAPLYALDDLVRAYTPGWQRPAALYDLVALAEYASWGCSYVACERGDDMRGYLLAQPIAFEGDALLTIWVDALAVHPHHRRRGIATRLYLALGQHAARGTMGVLTRVEPHNTAALGLHRAIGFVAHADDALLWRLSMR
jgi:ribosomal protein S18 acetylase RimI-like enzyme